MKNFDVAVRLQKRKLKLVVDVVVELLLQDRVAFATRVTDGDVDGDEWWVVPEWRDS